MLKTILLRLVLASLSVAPASHLAAQSETYDVVIYGGTSAGIAAAVQVKRMGGTVVVIEPTRRIGGLTTGGLGQTDIGNKAAIGGVALEFYQRVRKHYDQPEHWKWQRRDEYRDGGQTRTGQGEQSMWTFEPSAALTIMQDLVREYDIPVAYQQRLDRTGNVRTGEQGRGVTKDHARIVAIRMETGETYRGRMFIDATYEGDLLAAAGVSYVVGREANATYSETLNGVQTQHAKLHQLLPAVDPYVTPGSPASGLLPGIDPRGPGEEGSGDARVQAYCFRMCLTDHPENRIPFVRPADYDPLVYELMLRNFEAGERGMPWINSDMPNRKTDTNNRTGFSTDFIGGNYDYPEASYADREQIIARHRSYQQGLMWTLANDPRVPDKIRHEVARWGMCRDEFTEGAGWQEQLYIREARRLIGAYVMTQHNCQGRMVAERPIGLAAYTMDSHNTQRYVDAQGHARNEGDVEVGGFPPYPIDYGSITPQRAECENLLVPVCLSATHIAFGSIRMEPVFMVLGQSAATAAIHALADDVAVQAIDYDKLRDSLLADGQVLEWTGPAGSSAHAVDPKSLPGIVVDDEPAERHGFDAASQVIGPFVGVGYRHDGNLDKGRQAARFTFRIPNAGRYEVRVAYSPNDNRATNVPISVQHAGGLTTVRLNQRQPPAHVPFASVGSFDFTAGDTSVAISNAETDGYVVVDAVQLLPADATKQSANWHATGTLAAEEAVQAAAADEQHVYAIANSLIAKYDRQTGERLAISTGEAKHLNSGFILEGKLYCAHSNYPSQPERSEIKILDPQSMALTTFHDFGDFGGSLTWCVWHAGHWWCNFAKYGNANSQTFLVQFNEQWEELHRWTYPPEVISSLGAYSLSGGIWRDDMLLVTDHDHRRLYQLQLPANGNVLEFVGIVEAPFTGQGIASDPRTGGLLGIDRAKRRVVFASQSAFSAESLWDLQVLSQAPKWRWLDESSPIRSLIYESEPYNGHVSEVFAFYATPGTLRGVPATDHDLPAVVLVHGGGGTAFAEWVSLWANRGYAAIAMDLSGRGPAAPEFDPETRELVVVANHRDITRERLKFGGPEQGSAEKFDSIGGELLDDWPYHAVSSVIRAHSLIRSFPEVNKDRTAVTGISWGGYLTNIVASVDSRFKAAVPVYGCGFLYEGESVQKQLIDRLRPEQRTEWIRLYDPSTHLSRCRVPILFVNGTNDQHYPLDSYARSYSLVHGPRNLRIEVNMPHGHQPGWKPQEIGLFIDQYLRDGEPLVSLGSPQLKPDQVVATISSTTLLTAAALHYTIDSGPLLERRWITIAASIDDNLVAAPAPPAATTIWYLTVTDEREAMVSSEIVFAEAAH